MWARLKHWIQRYDQWCRELGLTAEQRRSCVPYRKESADDRD
ncbi:DUF5363 family protein [Vibrio sp. PP-XX7]